MPTFVNEEEAYRKWLELVEHELREFELSKLMKQRDREKVILKQEDIKDYMLAFNELLFLNTSD